MGDDSYFSSTSPAYMQRKAFFRDFLSKEGEVEDVRVFQFCLVQRRFVLLQLNESVYAAKARALGEKQTRFMVNVNDLRQYDENIARE